MICTHYLLHINKRTHVIGNSCFGNAVWQLQCLLQCVLANAPVAPFAQVAGSGAACQEETSKKKLVRKRLDCEFTRKLDVQLALQYALLLVSYKRLR